MPSLLLRRLVLGAAGLALAACGEAAPTVDADVADELAGRADVLASRLEADDHCGAIETAGELVAAAAGGRDAGTVPPAIADEVIATTRDTVRGLTCDPEPEPEPAPPPPAEDDDDTDDERGKGKGEGQGKGKGEGKGKDGDD